MYQMVCVDSPRSCQQRLHTKRDSLLEQTNTVELMNCVSQRHLGSSVRNGVVLFLIIVLHLRCGISRAQEAIPSKGDVEDLKAVASAWTQNQLALRTWEAKVRQTRKSEKTDNTFESTFKCEFSYEREKNRLVCVGFRERFETTGGQRVAVEKDSGFLGVLRTEDSYMRVFRSTVEQTENKRRMQVIAPSSEEKPSWLSGHINPVVFMQHDRTPVDIEIGNDIKDYVFGNGSGFEIEKVGTLVRFTHRSGNFGFRKDYDLSKGGNPVFDRYESTEPGAVLTIQITTSYHEVDGVWIPESADYLRQEVSQRDDIHVTFFDDRVNQELSDDRFSMQRLGFVAGDMIWDKRIKAEYTYEPEEVPVAESAVKVDAVPELNEPSPAEPALAAADSSKPAISSSALPADPNAVTQVRPLPWWKNYAVIATAIVFGSLVVLLFLRARRPSPSSPPSEQSQI